DEIHIVKTIIRNTEFGDKFEGGIHLMEGAFFGCWAFIPGHGPWTPAKRITTISAEAVPVGHRKAEMFGHGFISYLFTSVIKSVGKWIFRIRAFVLYR